MEPERLCAPPIPACTRTPTLVLTGRVRRRRVSRCDRGRPRYHAPLGRGDTVEAVSQAGTRAEPFRGAVPPERLVRARIRTLVAAVARRADRVRSADVVAGRQSRTPVLRQSENDDRARTGDPRPDGLSHPAPATSCGWAACGRLPGGRTGQESRSRARGDPSTISAARDWPRGLLRNRLRHRAALRRLGSGRPG